jgi:hypothetical protein
MTNHHPSTHPNTFRILSILVISVFLLSACGGKSAALQAVPTATTPPQPTATTVPPTATATQVPTDTPEPTSTPTPDLTATAAVQATATTDAVMAMVKPELDKVGVTPADGHLVWHNDEDIVLSATSYNEWNYQALKDAGSLKNFVMHADIGWNSTSGLAGCGFVFRSGEDFDTSSQYKLLLVRLQSAPGWLMDYFNLGKWQYSLNGSDDLSRAILDKPDSVNKLTLVARGQDLLTFINGEKMRLLESNKQLEGSAAFMVDQESGTTTCTFSNGWIYSLDK